MFQIVFSKGHLVTTVYNCLFSDVKLRLLHDFRKCMLKIFTRGLFNNICSTWFDSGFLCFYLTLV